MRQRESKNIDFRPGGALGILGLSCQGVRAASRIAGAGSREELLALVVYGVFSFVVTTAIEALVLRKTLRLGWSAGLRLSGLVNLVSALACLPLGIWLGGSEHELIPLAAYWRWSTAGLWAGAVLIETVVARLLVKGQSTKALATAVIWANTASYGLYLLLKFAL